MKGVVLALIAVIIVAAIGIGVWYYVSTPPPKKLLKVGTSPDFPPFEYIDEKGNVVGFDMDLIRALAKKIGYDDIEIITMDFDALIPALKQGKIDVIAAGMTITEKRKEEVDFTIPYWNADQAILVRKASDFRPKSPDELAGRKVGVQTGTTGEYYIVDYENRTGIDIDIKSYSSFVLAVQDLVNGRIDAVIVDTPVASMFEKQYDVVVSAIIKTGEQYGFAVRKGETELLNKLNQALDEFMKSAEWSKLVQKYFGSG
ncbi:MAG: basic amino acid ABC transporter substrate-binding protein [Thermoprotei archaeon]|nr:MAG: basic amino acid ABC transporter substrate-binding protein [Thermoprotei archaeon]